ncbi:hypothetical protein SAMN04488498_101225 [Mesorhizobium albiziae]|uniref:Uncharacterized protein n=1 Tax=Neomesorhizobium albiziae TaxID=335020 RepID=A0A1I3V591_9HYPH|nr:hypothetical protein [Mesorhizobium albiziae]GLS28682.1 hypothetical protein GCM10007937_03890 [Mesorhizobium albiziae]SFJ90814.1 hypothetical protein SAMN04488498_101225 [Mesorhizobium albiziae]
MRLSLLIGFLLASALAETAQAVEVSFSTPRTSSELTSTLAIGQPVFIEVAYTGDREMRFQARAFSAGEFLDAGQVINLPLPQPSGSNTALVWVQFETAAAADEIRVTAFDAMNKPIAVRSLKADLRWTGDPATRLPQPAWVDGLMQQQDSYAERRQHEIDAAREGVISRFFGLVGGYVGG